MDKQSLQASLAQFDQCEKYRVEEVLRSSAFETTEVVYQISVDGSANGPFIRKRFPDPDLLNVYRRILDAQSNGLRDISLPKIYEASQDGDGCSAVIEYVRGANLRQAQEKMSSLKAFEGVCAAVQVIHEKFSPPIIHRDIKPDNVIVTQDGMVLIDFGAARTYDEGKSRDTRLYATRAYASPEQFGFSQTDCRSDIYSLGMLLAFLELGEDPGPEVKEAVGHGPEALMRLGIAAIPSNVIFRACAFDPDKRFASVSEMIEFMHSQYESLLPPPAPETAISLDLEKGASNVVTPASYPGGYFGERSNSKATFNPSLAARRLKESWISGEPAVARRAWNSIIAAIWLFFFAVAIYLCIEPGPNGADMPIWQRILEYIGMSSTLIAACAIALLNGNGAKPELFFRGHWKLRSLACLAVVFFACAIVASIFGIRTS